MAKIEGGGGAQIFRRWLNAGVLPRSVSEPTALVGYVHTQSKAPDAAQALLRYLSSPEVAGIYGGLGMVPGR